MIMDTVTFWKPLMFVIVASWISGGQSDIITAECVLSKNEVGEYNDTISGTVTLTQIDNGDTILALDLSGFYTGEGSVSDRGFHIHTEGTIGAGGCADTGGHYNPFGVNHGAPTAVTRHVGDLGNIKVAEDGKIRTALRDSMVSLQGDNTVIGRAIVIHEGTDDLGLGGDEGSRTTGNAGGRPACCIITDTTESITSTTTAECQVEKNPVGDYTDDITGTVTLTQINGGDTIMELDLSGFYGSGVSERGFHIHTEGTIGDNGCGDTGGHYNPLSVDHGAPTDSTRHVGDLGNIVVAGDGTVKSAIVDNLVSLQGSNSVVNRAIVIHQGTDDLGRGGDEGSRTTGNAGPRPACCIITASSSGNIKCSLSLIIFSIIVYIFYMAR